MQKKTFAAIFQDLLAFENALRSDDFCARELIDMNPFLIFWKLLKMDRSSSCFCSRVPFGQREAYDGENSKKQQFLTQ